MGEDGDDLFDKIEQPEGKIGAKKLRKLQEKAERKEQRLVLYLYMYNDLFTHTLVNLIKQMSVNVFEHVLCIFLAFNSEILYEF